MVGGSTWFQTGVTLEVLSQQVAEELEAKHHATKKTPEKNQVNLRIFTHLAEQTLG